jgi:hypothetical protein
VKVADQVKTFNDARFRHPNESIHFPNIFNQGHDEDHRNHPLHQTLLKHGYSYSFTTPVHQPDGSIHHHHVWQNGHHQVGAYAGKTEFSSKTSASSGHVFTGIGKIALSKHLANKQRRYKLQNNARK